MALYINNYDRDAEQAKLLAEYAAQRERLNITVKEADVLTVDELAQVIDYEEDILDREDWARGAW
jgi:hypothetical protein